MAEEIEAGGANLKPGDFATPTTSGTRKIPIDSIDLGTHVVVYFTDGTSQVLPKSRFPSEGAGRTPDPDLGRQQEFDAEQNRLDREEKRRQYDETFHKDKAKFNTEFGLDVGKALGRYFGTPTLQREMFDEDRRQFGLKFPEEQRQFDVKNAIDHYKYISEVASNPRNFIQQFFQMRGQQAPPGSERFGNSPGLSAVMPLGQFLPNFLSTAGAQSSNFAGYTPPGVGTGRVPVQQAPVAQAPAQAAVAPPVQAAPAPVAQAAATPIVEQRPAVTHTYYDQSSGTPVMGSTGPAGEAKTGGQVVNGQYTGGTNLVPFDLSQWGGKEPDWFRNALRGFARGGIIPEPVTGFGDWSGTPYKFGERGPEGVVPSHLLPDFLKDRGGSGSYYMGGEIGFDSGLYGEKPQQTDSGYLDPNAPLAPTAAAPYVAPYVAPTAAPAPSAPVAAPAPTYSITSDMRAAMDAEIARVAQINAARNTVVTPSTSQGLPPLQTGPIQRGEVIGTGPGGRPILMGSSGPQLAPANVTATSPVVPGTYAGSGPGGVPIIIGPDGKPGFGSQNTPVAPTILPTQSAPQPTPQQPTILPTQSAPQPTPQQPTFLPQNGQTAAPQNPAAPTVREVSTPGTFGNTVGTSTTPSARPRFLPGEDTPLSAMLAEGYLPPFLSRLFGQREGVQSQGTNTPQRLDLPKDVPIISRLAFMQMTPSERQALLSFVSAYGITPEDYIAFIEQFSPSGPQTRLPTFGQAFQGFRQ